MSHLFSSPALAKDLMDPEAVPLRPGKIREGPGFAISFRSVQWMAGGGSHSARLSGW